MKFYGVFSSVIDFKLTLMVLKVFAFLFSKLRMDRDVRIGDNSTHLSEDRRRAHEPFLLQDGSVDTLLVCCRQSLFLF